MTISEQKLADINAELEAEAKAAEANQPTPEELAAKQAEYKRIEDERIAAEKAKALENETEEEKTKRLTLENTANKKSFEDLIKEDEVAKAKAERVAKAEKLLENPMMKSLMDFADAGLTPDQIAETITSIKQLDPKDISDKDLFMRKIANEKNEDGQLLSEEEKNDAYEAFLTQPKTVQNQFNEAERAELTKKHEEAKTKLNIVNPLKAAFDENATKSMELIYSKAKELIGTDFKGLTITPEIAIEFYNEALIQLKSNANNDGTFDTQKPITNALKIVTYDKLEAIAKENGVKEGLKKAFEKTYSPSEDGKPAAVVNSQNKSAEELEDEAIEKERQLRNPSLRKKETV
jgi:hypothetical protein